MIGIYFADMVSKSTNYCHASYEKPRGLALLSEVALGKTYDCTGAEYIEKLPAGHHSCKGLGKTIPNPAKTITLENGCQGKPPMISSFTKLNIKFQLGRESLPMFKIRPYFTMNILSMMSLK